MVMPLEAIAHEYALIRMICLEKCHVSPYFQKKYSRAFLLYETLFRLVFNLNSTSYLKRS